MTIQPRFYEQLGNPRPGRLMSLGFFEAKILH